MFQITESQKGGDFLLKINLVVKSYLLFCLTLMTLKLVGFLQVSWFIILCPLWLPLLLAIVVLIIVINFADALNDKK